MESGRELRTYPKDIDKQIMKEYVKWNNPHYSEKEITEEAESMLYFFYNYFTIEVKNSIDLEDKSNGE